MGSRPGVARHAFRGDDPLLNMLARAYSAAFKQAESDDYVIANRARLELCAFFSQHNLKRLHQQGCISWKPEEVQ